MVIVRGCSYRKCLLWEIFLFLWDGNFFFIFRGVMVRGSFFCFFIRGINRSFSGIK